MTFMHCIILYHYYSEVISCGINEIATVWQPALYKLSHKLESLLGTIIPTYMCVKALPRVCTGNTARGGVSRGKYSTRRSRVLYLPRDTPECCIFRT